MELRWKKMDELPMDEPMYKKVLLITEGKSDEIGKLYVITDYWQVFLDEDNIKFKTYKKKQLGDRMFSYGRFMESMKKIPLDKIKCWMFADDLVKLYHMDYG